MLVADLRKLHDDDNRRLDVADEMEAAHALCRGAEAAYIAALAASLSHLRSRDG
jgi:hypothetical protein